MRNPYLCLAIVVGLVLFALVGMGGIIGLTAAGKVAPESLISLVSVAVGALSSFLVSPPRGSVGIDPERH